MPAHSSQANLPAPNGGWGPAWASCVDPAPLPTVVGSGSCISFDSMLKRVRVTVPQRNVPTVFSGVLGVSSLSASATSTATLGSRPVADLCPLRVRRLQRVPEGRPGHRGRRGHRGEPQCVELRQPDGESAARSGSVEVVTGAGPCPHADRRHPPCRRPLRRHPGRAPQHDAERAAGLRAAVAAAFRPPAVRPRHLPGHQQLHQLLATGTGTYFVTGRPERPTSASRSTPTPQMSVLFFTCSAPGPAGSIVAAACCARHAPCRASSARARTHHGRVRRPTSPSCSTAA